MKTIVSSLIFLAVLGPAFFAQAQIAPLNFTLHNLSEDLKEVDYQPTDPYFLSTEQYVVVGGLEQFPNDGAESSQRVLFMNNFQNDILWTSSLPQGLYNPVPLEVNGNLFVFGGDPDFQDNLPVHQGIVYRYETEMNSFEEDFRGESFGAFAVKYQQDGQRVVRTFFFKQFEGESEYYVAGKGWFKMDGTPSDVVFDLRTTSAEEEVTKIYKDYLQREPDQAGLRYWSEQRKEGLTIREIQDAFRNSYEYQVLAADQELVLLYRTVLKREPDLSGLAFWTNQKLSGFSLERIEREFYLSEEYKNLTSSLDHFRKENLHTLQG